MLTVGGVLAIVQSKANQIRSDMRPRVKSWKRATVQALYGCILAFMYFGTVILVRTLVSSIFAPILGANLTTILSLSSSLVAVLYVDEWTEDWNTRITARRTQPSDQVFERLVLAQILVAAREYFSGDEAQARVGQRVRLSVRKGSIPVGTRGVVVAAEPHLKAHHWLVVVEWDVPAQVRSSMSGLQDRFSADEYRRELENV